MVKIWQRLIWIGIIAALVIASLLPVKPAEAGSLFQATDPLQRAKTLLAKMTPEEKVGQLFMVTFRGRDVTSKDAKVLDLVKNRLVGGILLKSANDNFTGSQGTIEEVYRVTSELQKARWSASQTTLRNAFGFSYTPQYIPLTIAVSQLGDQYPSDQILSGLTPLPSEMALGATWNAKQVERAGVVLGDELAALGINVLLGPALNVAENSSADTENNLGVQAFGGSPYWVGEISQAFIRGVHQGSGKKLAVIPQNFPGIGAADRASENELATVRKSVEQLKASDLVPFMAVTGNAGSVEAMADGLLVTSNRYQGWQGAIRPNTKPLSFDTAALDQVLALPELARWRQNSNGILISEDLGSQAIRKFYDSTGQSYDPRQVARSALLGGCDLLYADNLTALGDADSYTTFLKVLDFFVQKYREDPAFAQRIDASVLRILTLKFKLYAEFALDNVVPSPSEMTVIGTSQQVTFDLARQSVTLVYPPQAELNQLLPRPPDLRERIVVLTDLVTYRQCSQCPATPALAVDALQTAALRLYGPRAGGQIAGTSLSSYSFLDLKYYLDETKDKIPAGLDDNLKLADWVWVALVDNNPARPEAQAFRQLLAKRPDLLRNKKVVVFAFNTPYALDATDLSKISAYYALYSKSLPFVEVAVRILFQELTPAGALPVTVVGSGYDLSAALSPDPNQVISLEVDQPGQAATPQVTSTPRPGATTSPTPSVTPTVQPTVKVGDLLPLRTGIILDHNRNPVPDGTQVNFILSVPGGESGVVQQIAATTVGGIARASYRIQSGGSLEIRVVSGQAQVSKQLRLNISPTGAVAITAVTPTVPPPTPTITPTVTVTPTATPSPTPTPTPTPPPPQPGTDDWFLSLLIAWGAAGLIFWIGRLSGSLRWAVRWGLLAAAGGLLAYTYLAAGLPGSLNLMETVGKVGLRVLTAVGVVAGWLVGLFWRLVSRKETPVMRGR